MNDFDISCPPVSELSVSSPYDTLSRVEDNGFLRIEGLGEALAYVQREEEPDECGLLRGAVSKWTTVDPARSRPAVEGTHAPGPRGRTGHPRGRSGEAWLGTDGLNQVSNL